MSQTKRAIRKAQAKRYAADWITYGLEKAPPVDDATRKEVEQIRDQLAEGAGVFPDTNPPSLPLGRR